MKEWNWRGWSFRIYYDYGMFGLDLCRPRPIDPYWVYAIGRCWPPIWRFRANQYTEPPNV